MPHAPVVRVIKVLRLSAPVFRIVGLSALLIRIVGFVIDYQDCWDY